MAISIHDGRLSVPLTRNRLTLAMRMALVATLYFLLAQLGLTMAFASSSVTAIWPPTGLALAALILWGPKMWPAIALGALFANLATPAPILAVVGITIGNTLEAVVGAYLLSRVGFRNSMERMRDVVALVALGALISTMISASIGVASLWAAGVLPQEAIVSTTRVWWLGDMGGDLLIAPAILVLAARPKLQVKTLWLAEAVALTVGLVVVSSLVFHSGSPLAYTVFPLLFWTALRFRQPGAVVAGLLVAGFAVWHTAHGRGPFVGGSPDADLLGAQTFVAVATITALLVAAVRSERLQAESDLAAIAESERQLGEAQALAHVGSWSWEIAADDVRWSEELYRMYGLSPADLEATFEGYLERVHEDDRERVQQEIASALDRRSPFQFRHRIVQLNGNVRTVESRGQVSCDSTGAPTRMSGTCQDITAFELAESRFSSLLEAAPDAMVIIDRGGEIVMANSQAEDMFRNSGTTLIGEGVERLIPDWYRATDSVGVGATDPQRHRIGEKLDLRSRREDGTEFPVEVSIGPVEAEQGTLTALGIRDITERKQASDRLEYQALHDSLTGLPNRPFFVERLEQAIVRAKARGTKLAVLFCDIDNFKIVNDSLGHDVGDEFLVAMTPRFEAAVRAGDTVARFGGDEFVILCEEVGDEAEALRIAHRLCGEFQEPVKLADRTHVLGLSVGMVFVKGGDASATGVLRDADAAMYRAKAAGGGRFEVFDERLRSGLDDRLRLEMDLRKALVNNELWVAYQPIVSLADRRIIGAEALVRWQHPERGLLHPATFIEIAEHSGLIVPVGNWVLEQSCLQAVKWSGANGDDFKMSVNLSPRQLTSPDVIETVASVLQRTGIAPQQLTLEITESSYIGQTGGQLDVLYGLHELGVQIVLDDFGTGYSSLSHLKKLPIDALKIDQTFVAGLGIEPQDTAIVAAVLSMARELELGVIAEGIETADQLSRLLEDGCKQGQGYLFSRPVAAQELTQMMSNWAVAGSIGASADRTGELSRR